MKETSIIYFQGLNGLRAIASLAVVVSHTTLALGDFGLNPHVFGTFHDGSPKGLLLAGYGVTIFFVLSGFLITYLLQQEKVNNEINIKKFYMRRIFRIWPLYYAYLLICIIVVIQKGETINSQSLLFYTFFAANIPFLIGNMIPSMFHYWSLGAEEQFYLFWPWVNKKINRLVNIIPFLVGGIILLKLYLHFFLPQSFAESFIEATKFHCMLIGAYGALLYRKREDRSHFLLRFADNKYTQVLCWICVFLISINFFHIVSVIDNEFIAIVSLCLIIGQINVKNRVVNLETKTMNFLGKISYGIYVIHPLLILGFSNLLSKINIIIPVKYILVYLIVIGATIGIAYLSYNYFERYFLKLKEKFQVIRSASHIN